MMNMSNILVKMINNNLQKSGNENSDISNAQNSFSNMLNTLIQEKSLPNKKPIEESDDFQGSIVNQIPMINKNISNLNMNNLIQDDNAVRNKEDKSIDTTKVDYNNLVGMIPGVSQNISNLDMQNLNFENDINNFTKDIKKSTNLESININNNPEIYSQNIQELYSYMFPLNNVLSKNNFENKEKIENKQQNEVTSQIVAVVKGKNEVQGINEKTISLKENSFVKINKNEELFKDDTGSGGYVIKNNINNFTKDIKSSTGFENMNNNTNFQIFTKDIKRSTSFESINNNTNFENFENEKILEMQQKEVTNQIATVFENKNEVQGINEKTILLKENSFVKTNNNEETFKNDPGLSGAIIENNINSFTKDIEISKGFEGTNINTNSDGYNQNIQELSSYKFSLNNVLSKNNFDNREKIENKQENKVPSQIATTIESNNELHGINEKTISLKENLFVKTTKNEEGFKEGTGLSGAVIENKNPIFTINNKIIELNDESSQLKATVLSQLEDRIVFMAKDKEGIQNVTMELFPKNLGKVNIKMSIEAEKITIEIMASDKKTGSILVSNAQELTKALQNNFNHTTVEVTLTENSLNQYNHSDLNYNKQQRQQNNREQIYKKNIEDIEEESNIIEMISLRSKKLNKIV